VFFITAKLPLKKGFYGVRHISAPISDISQRSVNFPSLIVGYAAPVINAHLNGCRIMLDAPPLRVGTHLNCDNVILGR
jgi:hypothetical protein